MNCYRENKNFITACNKNILNSVKWSYRGFESSINHVAAGVVTHILTKNSIMKCILFYCYKITIIFRLKKAPNKLKWKTFKLNTYYLFSKTAAEGWKSHMRLRSCRCPTSGLDTKNKKLTTLITLILLMYFLSQTKTLFDISFESGFYI